MPSLKDSSGPVWIATRPVKTHGPSSGTGTLNAATSIVSNNRSFSKAITFSIEHPARLARSDFNRPESFEIVNLPAGEEIEFPAWHEKGAGTRGALEAKKGWNRGPFKLKLKDGETKDLGTIASPAGRLIAVCVSSGGVLPALLAPGGLWHTASSCIDWAAFTAAPCRLLIGINRT